MSLPKPEHELYSKVYIKNKDGADLENGWWITGFSPRFDYDTNFQWDFFVSRSMYYMRRPPEEWGYKMNMVNQLVQPHNIITQADRDKLYKEQLTAEVEAKRKELEEIERRLASA